MHKLKAFFIVLLLLLNIQLWAREVITTLEPNKLLIGEHATLSFTIEYPARARLEIPVFNEMINEKIEILHYGSNDTIREPGRNDVVTINRKLRVTSWEEGFHAIAPFSFLLIDGNDTIYMESEPLLLEVETFSIEEHTDLKDIKDIQSAPITLAELKYYILGLIILALFIWWLVRYFKNRKVAPEPESIWEKPEIPAHIAAISSLEQLKAMKLWQQGKVKEYHVRLTDIVRHYIEKRFNVGAMEMTTSEIMHALEPVSNIDSVRPDLLSILQLADLVKFAKGEPLPNENDHSMSLAFDFVHQTKEQEETKNNET
jgi:hypothetical protein